MNTTQHYLSYSVPLTPNGRGGWGNERKRTLELKKVWGGGEELLAYAFSALNLSLARAKFAIEKHLYGKIDPSGTAFLFLQENDESSMFDSRHR